MQGISRAWVPLIALLACRDTCAAGFSFDKLPPGLRSEVDHQVALCLAPRPFGKSRAECFADSMLRFVDGAAGGRELFDAALAYLPEPFRAQTWQRLKAFAHDPSRDYVEVAIAAQNILHHLVLEAPPSEERKRAERSDRLLIGYSDRVAQISMLAAACEASLGDCSAPIASIAATLPDLLELSVPTEEIMLPPEEVTPRHFPLAKPSPGPQPSSGDSALPQSPDPKIRLSLTPDDLQNLVAQDARQAAEAAYQRRLAVHRAQGPRFLFGAFRRAFEGYVPAVRPGNQVPLGEGHGIFVSYLKAVHSKIHRIFGDGFLRGLDRMSASNPLNRDDLRADLEIVLRPEDGSIAKLGVVRASGVTAYDVGAIDAVTRAAPFGPVPREIESGDGLVYFHWEFHRDAEMCGTFRPYKLR